MKQKLLTIFTIFTLLLSFTYEANASSGKTDAELLAEAYEPFELIGGDERDVDITSTEKTVTTTRLSLTSSQSLKVQVDTRQLGSMGTLAVSIFKNGEHYQSYVKYALGLTTNNIWRPGAGEYSLRLYCGNPNDLQTGCRGLGVITRYNN